LGHVRCRLDSCAYGFPSFILAPTSCLSPHRRRHVPRALTCHREQHVLPIHTLHHYHHDTAYYCLASFSHGRLFLFKPFSPRGRLPHSLLPYLLLPHYAPAICNVYCYIFWCFSIPPPSLPSSFASFHTVPIFPTHLFSLSHRCHFVVLTFSTSGILRQVKSSRASGMGEGVASAVCREIGSCREIFFFGEGIKKYASLS